MSQNHDRSRLHEIASTIVSGLGGKWASNGAMCRCPAHQDSNPSLSVRVGDRNILFKCFAGCPTPVVLRAIRAARLQLPPQQSAGAAQHRGDIDSRMAARAAEIWDEALPISNSLGQVYFEARAIEHLGPALRFHPRTPVGGGRNVRFRPAVIAALHQRRCLVGIQRIFLSRDGRGLASDMVRPKLMLGRPLRGAVALAPAATVLGLAEGVETALSASVLMNIPVWAALGNERLARIELPPVVSRVILLPDADPAGRLAARRSRIAYSNQGLVVETRWPWHGLNDWNDVLREGGERREARLRQAA